MPSTAQEEGKYFKYTDKSYLILQGVILKDIKPRSFKMSQFFFFFFFRFLILKALIIALWIHFP